MHRHHDHSHDHDHSHSHSHEELQINNGNKSNIKLSQNVRILISALLIIIPSIIRRKVTRLDFGLFLIISSTFLVVDTLKAFVKDWITKVRTVNDMFWKHTSPLTRNFFFKNENAADRVTLLGIFVNIVLSITKFAGGILFNSAVLVADAGHSLSDLFSDFITLWAVQISRIPADEDHPYGHGKFESIASLFLALSLLGTGLSVGSWSYDKFVVVCRNAALLSSSQISSSSSAAIESVLTPSWPALVLAAGSIFSKEWLYRITKRVGQLLNSQILIANAWHHRSDAFSSILSLVSIALAMLMPQFSFADAGGGLLIAGMICFSGIEILFESVKQLSDTSDNSNVPEIRSIVENTDGVLGVSSIRTRSVGSGEVVDILILTDTKISVSSSHAIAERARWSILQKMPSVIEVSIKSRFIEPVCPLLSQSIRSLADIEKEIKTHTEHEDFKDIQDIDKVTIHYLNTFQISAEVVIKVNSGISFDMAVLIANKLRDKVLSGKDVVQADVLVNLTSILKPEVSIVAPSL